MALSFLVFTLICLIFCLFLPLFVNIGCWCMVLLVQSFIPFPSPPHLIFWKCETEYIDVGGYFQRNSNLFWKDLWKLSHKKSELTPDTLHIFIQGLVKICTLKRWFLFIPFVQSFWKSGFLKVSSNLNSIWNFYHLQGIHYFTTKSISMLEMIL